MRLIKLFLISLFCISLFSCGEQEEEILPEKPLLNTEELMLYLVDMVEFQEYARENHAEALAIVEKKREISKKQFDLVSRIHHNYPTLKAFYTFADQGLYETYKKLTGIDLLQANPGSQEKFEIFINQLQSEVLYTEDDLLDAMFQLEYFSLEETEKSQTGCTDACFISAIQEQYTIPASVSSQIIIYNCGKCSKSCSTNYSSLWSS